MSGQPALSGHGLLLQLLAKARRAGADMLYVVPGQPPALRAQDRLLRLRTPPLTGRHTRGLVMSLLDARQRVAFGAAGELSLSIAVEAGRPALQARAYLHDGAPAMSVRLVPADVDTLQLRRVQATLRGRAFGLVLVASPSPVLRAAACAGLGLVSVRTLGPARQAHDVQTVERALADAASGLVALCIATDAAVPALERAADGLDDDRRAAFADAVCAVVALRLLPASGAFPAVAAEWLLDGGAIAAHVAQADWNGLEETMTRQRKPGLRTIDQSLVRLHRDGNIATAAALAHARDADEVQRELALHPRAVDAGAPAAGPLDVFETLAGGTPLLPIDAMPGPALPAAAAPPGDPAPPVALTFDRMDALFGLPAPPPHAARPVDPVQFRAYVPPRLVPGVPGLVEVWVALPSQAAAVAALATTGQTVAAGLRSGIALARGTVIGVRLRVDGARVRPTVQTMVWAGEPANVSFPVTLPEETPAGTRAACAHLLADGIAIGELHFLVAVGARPGAELAVDAQARLRPYRSAFASYASDDRPEVLARVQGMKAVAPDLDIFLDTLSLQAGDRWQERVEHEVATRERLFLFWSESAKKSTWVDFEWRLSLRTKGLEAIEPVPLADPRVAPPPPELAALHFNDAYLAYICGDRAFARQSALP